jgi:type II secretory pathway pseudopilin PulG
MLEGTLPRLFLSLRQRLAMRLLHQTRRTAFSLIEAMVALSITAMAGAVLLLATQGVVETTNDAIAQTIAQGMAAQLIDEVLGARYCHASDPYETTLGPTAAERVGSRRDRFNDSDDFHDYTARPPQDTWGKSLGQGDWNGSLRHPALRSPGDPFNQWRQKVEVYYVDPSDPTVRKASGQWSDYRAVEVTIERVETDGAIRPLAKLRRVYCYVPIP